MAVYVDYPEDWIGIPEFGEGELFGEPRAWASALTDELVDDTGETLDDSERGALVSALALVATDVTARGSVASYVWLASLRGPVHVVDTVLVARSETGDAAAHEVAGSLETDVLRAPVVTDVVTDRGLRGALVVRHAPLDADAPHVVTLRATYALDVGPGFIVLGTATQDLAQFEAFRPHFRRLIDSVRADD